MDVVQGNRFFCQALTVESTNCKFHYLDCISF
jgi:hypothetical protein